MAVGFAALAAAGVIGGVTAVSLVGGQERPAEQVRTVSDEATVTPTADATSPGASALPTTAPAATPAAEPSKTAAKTTTRHRSQTVTEADPAPTEPTTEPTPTEEASGSSDLKPAPAGPPPSQPARCHDSAGYEIPCP